MAAIKPIQGLTVFTLTMLMTGAIDSVRNLPATALFGTSLIFFFIFSALTFLVPTALVSAELTSTWPKEKGIYGWVKLAFGEKFAFIAVWLQWINTMVWYPTILSFIAGTAATLINPALAQNKAYIVTIILGTFWLLTLLNLKGIHTSAKFAKFCALFGMVIPMALIILLAFIWVLLGKPLQIHFTADNIFPSLQHKENWISLTAIMAAFLGMELAAVHVQEVANPQKAFPRALTYSVIIILITMIFGALAIAIVIPAKQINLVSGVTQAFGNFLAAYQLGWMLPVIVVMILVGSLGGMVNWIISPAKGLLQAAKSGYLPKILQRENQYGAASNLLILQAILVSVMCLAFLLMPSVNGSYWFLTDLSTQLYILMYIMMFVSALTLTYKYPEQPKAFKIPGGKFGMWLVCLAGLIGCTVTLIVGFFPPDGIDVGSTLHYELAFACGIAIMLLPAWYFCKRAKVNNANALLVE